eukprot:scaffold578_cov167-Amphora_coffeaeformis.AAC.10
MREGFARSDCKHKPPWIHGMEWWRILFWVPFVELGCILLLSAMLIQKEYCDIISDWARLLQVITTNSTGIRLVSSPQRHV